MITLFVEENNPLSQKIYNDLIFHLQFHQLTCTCGHSGCLSVHAYYKRSIKTSEGIIRLTICRVRCSCCGRTHALLPSSIVPYSQVSLKDHTTIITNYNDHISQSSLMDSSPLIDESSIRYIIRQYLHFWKQKLLSEKVSLVPADTLVPACFSFFSRQFMQIKSTPNILFRSPT